MTIIAIVNQKGGVAKTTTAGAIASGLHRTGKKVLMLDLDAQGNLTASVGAKQGGAMELLSALTVFPQSTEQGDVIASSPALAVADTQIIDVGKEYKLKEALEAFKEDYDYTVIDTAPALGILTVNALTAADIAVVPARADIFSLQGISQLAQTIAAVKKYTNPKLKVAGIVLTMYNKRAVLHREVAQILESAADQLDTKLFEAKIRPCNALAEAQARKRSIFDYAPKSNAALDYDELLTELLKEI